MSCLVTCKSAVDHTLVIICCNVTGKLEMEG